MQYNPFYNIENPELMSYEYAWVNFNHNNVISENIMHLQILESWQRCKLNGQDPTSHILNEHSLSHLEIDKKIEDNKKLLSVAEPIVNGLLEELQEKNLDVFIVDPDKITIKVASRNNINDRFLLQGYSCDEIYLGTNSVDLTIRHGKPINIVGAQHYYQQLHKFAVYSSPIFDRDNILIGVLGIAVRLERMSSYMSSLVITGAKAIENSMELSNSRDIISQQNLEQQEILDVVSDGIIYMNESRTITQVNAQFIKLSGLSKYELVGKNINIIDVSPKMNTFLEPDKNEINNTHVLLKGKEHNYSCFLTKDITKNKITNEDNTIWTFTRLDEIRELADELEQDKLAYFTFNDIIAKSKGMLECIALAKRVADHNARAIIEGESGTGKEVVAQSIHNRGMRKNGPFVAVDCGAIPKELLESELFGYEEGAYTGARKGGHRGKFELAHNGTLFLDEIGNLPLEMQAKLLRVLQESTVVRIGGYTPIHIDTQIIAATNQDLKKEVEEGTFREDLFYRINIVHIKLPPLRERKDDIKLLIKNYIHSSKGYKGRVMDIADDAMEILCNYEWPGNVRQLHNVLERMMILADGPSLKKELIPNEIRLGSNRVFNVMNPEHIDTLSNATANYVKGVLDFHNGNIKKTSEDLDVSRSTIYRILKKSNLL